MQTAYCTIFNSYLVFLLYYLVLVFIYDLFSISETETSAKEEGNESKTEETKNEDEDDVTKEGGGVKRPLEEDKSEEEKKPEKVDPSKAPDPEEPEKFDESALKSDLEEQFNPPEDDVTITLDRCE